MSASTARRASEYGLSPDSYASHKLLERFGLLEVVMADGRRHDGTFENFREGEAPVPHTFRIIEDGFGRPGVQIVMSTLKGLS
jgi:hypothetical protein